MLLVPYECVIYILHNKHMNSFIFKMRSKLDYSFAISVFYDCFINIRVKNVNIKFKEEIRNPIFNLI